MVVFYGMFIEGVLLESAVELFTVVLDVIFWDPVLALTATLVEF
jgi:hypothetical protein